MKVNTLECFKIEVNKAVSTEVKNIKIEYQTTVFSFSSKDKRWEIRQNGLLHCEWGPAIIYPDGTQKWCYMGWIHKEDGPAVIRPDGTQEWYYMSLRHRTDGPAVIKPDGTQKWYYMGWIHRTDGPAIIYSNGTQEWWLDGKRVK
jgi:hypothetical protein